MRPIKFDYLVKRENGYCFHQIFTIEDIENGNCVAWLNANIVCEGELHRRQFTGRKDWWEGDIAEQNGIIYVVVYEDCAFRFKTKSGGLVTMQGWSPEPTKIGNIHENKELL